MILLGVAPARASGANLWGDRSCPDHDAYASAAQERHLDDLILAGDPKWRVAYDYARSICFPIPLGKADRLLEEGRIQPAFNEYLNGFSAGLNPAYDDYGAAAPWRRGMQAGAHGDLAAAQKWFRNAIRVAASYRGAGFPEAHFMLGMTLYARGLRAQAVREWGATLSESGPPQPDWVEAGTVWPSALRLYGAAQGWNQK